MKLNLPIIILSTLALGACASTSSISVEAPGAKSARAVVTRSLLQPDRVEVALDGNVYQGEWREDGPTPEQKAATSYPHQKHIGVVHARLAADDGGVIDCRWTTHGDSAEGVCVHGDREAKPSKSK